MKWFRWIWLAATLALLGEAFYQAMYVAPAEATMGNIYRIFYYHVPAAMRSLSLFPDQLRSHRSCTSRRAIAIRCARWEQMHWHSHRPKWACIFCTAVLMMGMLWARPVWGIWWTWDARLTSTLVMWLIYCSYLLVRRFAAGPQMQTLAAAVAIFGYADVPIVYFSTRWWRTQHPSPVIGGAPDSGLDRTMWPALFWNLAAWLAWGLTLIAIRYAIERRRQQREQDEALRALEATLEATPWKENE